MLKDAIEAIDYLNQKLNRFLKEKVQLIITNDEFMACYNKIYNAAKTPCNSEPKKNDYYDKYIFEHFQKIVKAYLSTDL